MNASQTAVMALWGLFCAVWLVGAFKVRATKRVEDLRSRLLHNALVVVGAVALMPDAQVGPLGYQVIPGGPAREVAGVAILAAGVAFAVWARAYLGQNWSGRITLKQGHQLVQGGPYAWVRHPIYTGIFTAVLGTAVWEGRAASLLAVPLFAASWAWKIRLEEAWMIEEFGDRYRDYRRRVKALIPFIF